MPRWRSLGSVFTAVTTRSALIPLVMNVFEPFTRKWPFSRRALVDMPARSEPMPGSVIAIAVISSPETIPPSQRSRCSVVQ